MKQCTASLDLIYTSETFDYVPVKTIGMHTFRDIRYFCRDRDKFAKMMHEKLPELLADVNREKKHQMGTLIEEAGLLNWAYTGKLPQKIGAFELYITPDNPIDYINGSTLLLITVTLNMVISWCFSIIASAMSFC